RIAALSPEKRALLALRLKGILPASGADAVVAPIAVLGLGCRFPGGADSPDVFWHYLRAGSDGIGLVPHDRWHSASVNDGTASTPAQTPPPWGGFLTRVDGFDAAFFGLSPREAVHMDPQQRLLLEIAWEALEAAGQMTDRLAGSATGVFIGPATHSCEYSQMQIPPHGPLDTYTCSGTAHSILANRLSFCWDLRGPSLCVDTACSSSLVAVHLACQSLRLSECDLALAGGVNLML